MKPTFEFNLNSRQRGSFASRRKGSTQIEHSFQTKAADFSGCRLGESVPSFRGISRDYFQHEARGHFAAEALVFGSIALISLVPMVEAVRALFHFVYGVL
jgi:hypothetical protein